MARRTVQEKLAFVDAWHALNGHVSQRQYCLANNLLPGTFNKWLSNVNRLRQTAANKKNVQRTARHATDTAQLEAHVEHCARNNVQLTVIDLLAYARKSNLLQHADKYMARILFAFALRNPSPANATPRLLRTTDDPPSASPSLPPSTPDGYDFMHTQVVVFTEGLPAQRRENYGKCGCTDNCAARGSCINRACEVECDKDNCSTPRCDNRWCGHTLERQLEVFDTPLTGRGLQTTTAIPAHTVVIEYCGEYIMHDSYEKRCQDANPPPTTTYYMKCDDTYGIDARHYGSLARFINHAYKPNLVPVKRVVWHTTRVFLATVRNVQAGEELTFKYNTDIRFNCMCVAH